MAIFINDDPVLSINWHFYKELLNRSGRSKIVEKYDLDNGMYDQEEVAKLANNLFVKGSPDYPFINGIQTLWGWKKYEKDDIKEKIQAWVQNDFEPTYNGDAKLFNEKFRLNVRKILRWKDGYLPMKTTIREFCSNIADTGTAGSAFDPGGPKATINIDGEIEMTENNKFSKSGVLSVEQKIERITRKEKQKASVAIKTEFFPKVRLIISSSYNDTLKMRFVNKWLSEWMAGNKLSTLFMSKKQTFDMWKSFAEDLGNWNTPIDQAAYDHKITLKMIQIILTEMRSLILDRCPNSEELLLITDLIIYCLDGGYVIYKDGKISLKYEYKSGLLSGWQFTSIFGSICTLAQLLTSIDLVQEITTIRVTPLILNAQGDDILFRTKTLIESLSVVCAFRSFGFDIHPKKTFFSQKHNEYLRKYYLKGEINGYPARMINGLLWLYPGAKVPTDITEKLSSFTSKWQKLGERLHLKQKIINEYIIRDLSQAKTPIDTITKYMSTERIFGGSQQRQNTTNIQYTLTIDKKKTGLRYQIDDKGYQQFKMRYGKDQSRDLESWYIKMVLTPKEEEQIQETKEIMIPNSTPKPLRFDIDPSYKRPTTIYNEKFPKNVIFGKSHDFLSIPYPDIDSFINKGHAPKTWVYDYLSGHIKTTPPTISTMSTEFASLLWSQFEPSLINAMYHKRPVPDKWMRLQQYAEENFETFINPLLQSLPKMY